MGKLNLKLEFKFTEVKDNIAYIAVGIDGDFSGKRLKLDLSKLK